MSEHLRSIQSPADIKRMSVAQLAKLAQEIRELLISSLSKTGGHLGPNLGVVELTLAMHYVFDTPVDKFLFDVSHQTYVHKLLTGRADRFNTIRQPGGLERLYAAHGIGSTMPTAQVMRARRFLPRWAWRWRAIWPARARTLSPWRAMPRSPTASRLRR